MVDDYDLVQKYKRIKANYPKELAQIGMDNLLYDVQEEGWSPHEALSYAVDVRLLEVCVKLQRQINGAVAEME